MNFYRASITWEPKTKGIRDGSNQIELIEKNVSDKEQLQKTQQHFSWFNYWKKTSFIPPSIPGSLDGYKLRKKGILTDFLDYSPNYAGCPFMLNDTARKLLSEFRIPEHYYFPVTINTEETLVTDYQLFNLIFSSIEILDFPECVFVSGHEIQNNVQFHSFNTFEDFQNSGVSDKTLYKIAFSSKFDQTLDMFETRVGGLLVSESLKLAIEKNKLSGLEFRESIQR